MSTQFVQPYAVAASWSLWDAPLLRRNRALAWKTQARLRGSPALLSARVNSWTGRVRIEHTQGHPPETVAALIEEAIGAALREPSGGARARAGGAPEEKTMAPPGTPAVAVGVTALAVRSIVKSALRMFPGWSVWAGSAAALGGTVAVLRAARDEADDPVKLERDAAFRELLRTAEPYRNILLLAMASTVVSRTMQVTYVALVGTLTDALLSPRRVRLFGRAMLLRRIGVLKIGAALAALIAACSGFEYISRVLWMRAAHRIAHDLRLRLYEHVQSLELEQFSEESRGNYLALLNEDINRIELLFSAAWGVWNEVAYACCSTVGFYLISPGYVGLAGVPMPALLMLAQSLERRIRPRYAALRQQAGVVQGVLNNNIDGIPTIRAFGAEKLAFRWVQEASARFRDQHDEATRIHSSYNPVVLAAANGLRTATAMAAGLQASKGQLTPGTYVTLVILSTSLSLPMLSVARDFPHILSTLASLSRICKAFEVNRESREAGRALDAGQVRGAIRFEQVDFAYKRGRPVLAKLSVDIPAGKVSAFVGATGSGKSTLARLLLRFHEVHAGQILIDGQNIAELRREDVRRAIAYVGQEIFLFNGTIRENISFGMPGATLEAVEEAARMAGAHAFITQLPHGYEERTGELGQRLSGGQRQRIGIARALLTQRPIVVLDEVTASLDAVTEYELLQSLSQGLEGRTVIVVAHRLSAVRSAHRINVIDAGRVTESGQHHELLASGGRYARYWELQVNQKDLTASSPGNQGPASCA